MVWVKIGNKFPSVGMLIETKLCEQLCGLGLTFTDFPPSWVIMVQQLFADIAKIDTEYSR